VKLRFPQQPGGVVLKWTSPSPTIVRSIKYPPLAQDGQPPENVYHVSPNEVHLWCAELNGDPTPDILERYLSRDELNRADRIRDKESRRLSIVSRSFLRLMLAVYTGIPAKSIPIRYLPCPRCNGPHGRPVLGLATSDLTFSISRSYPFVLLGFAAGRSIGVDLETSRSRAAQDAIRSAATKAELAGLSDECDSIEEKRVMTKWWTRKEAYLKCLGLGIAVDLGKFEVTASSEPALLSGPGMGGRMLIADLDLQGGVGAVVAGRFQSPTPFSTYPVQRI
jgi:4'-phosphopantetheinyl transferase